MKKKIIAFTLLLVMAFGTGTCFATMTHLKTPITQNEKSAKIKQLAKGLKEYTNEFNNTKIYHYNAPLSLWTCVVDNDKVLCKFEVDYHGHGWIFMNGITIKTDNNIYNLKLQNVNRDVIYGDVVMEIGSYEIDDDSDQDMLNDIINSNNVKIRYDGQRYATAKLSKRSLEKMSKSLKLYRYIKES